jgi:hypothetical protein
MTRRAAFLAFVVVVLGWPSRADACSCIESGPACQAFWKTDAVFDATVDRIEDVSGPPQDLGTRVVSFPENLVRMTVRQALKGVAATGPIEVSTASEGSACGFDFKPGRRYLVFAWKRPADGRWVASLCSATQEYDGAGDTAAFVASLAAPAKGGRVFGTVNTYDKRFDYEHTSRERRVPARMRLIGAGREQSIVSTDGSYEFRGLEPGRYELEMDPPSGYASNHTRRNIEIPNGRACQRERFSVSPAGRVTGLVLDADGRPAQNVQIELTTPDAPTHPIYGIPVLSARTQSDGAFEIAGIPPGLYIVGVNLKDLPSKYNPYPRSVYPSDGSGDAVVQIGTAGTYDIGVWKLPPPLRVVRVSGSAVWTNATPAAGLYIAAWDVIGNPVERFV